MIWHSTYKEELGDMLSHSFKQEQRDIDVFYMLWHSYRISTLIKSTYFQMIRVGDGKYELTVQKCSVTDRLTVKFFKKNGSKTYNS